LFADVISTENQSGDSNHEEKKEVKDSSPIKIQVNSRDIEEEDEPEDRTNSSHRSEQEEESKDVGDSSEDKEATGSESSNKEDDSKEETGKVLDSSAPTTNSSSRSSVIVMPSRLNASNVTSNTTVSPDSESTSSSKTPFSPFSSRKETSDSSSSNSSRSFFLAKSRLNDVDPNESSSSNGCNIKITLKPSVLKVQDNTENKSSSSTNGNTFLLFGSKDSTKGTTESGPIRFTPLNSVFQRKLKVDDSEPIGKESKTNETVIDPEPTESVTTNNSSSTFSTFSVSPCGSSSTKGTAGGSAGFVFGQNLEERVTNVIKEDETAKEALLSAPVEVAPVLAEKRKYENITGEEGEQICISFSSI
jgi:hypothetical protein